MRYEALKTILPKIKKNIELDIANAVLNFPNLELIGANLNVKSI
jgi:hypothetical protein